MHVRVLQGLYVCTHCPLQLEHTSLKQERQWCRRLVNVKAWSHSRHTSLSLSSIHVALNFKFEVAALAPLPLHLWLSPMRSPATAAIVPLGGALASSAGHSALPSHFSAPFILAPPSGHHRSVA
eukprot:TRINITY_DN2727_c0_g1_i2.p1 TRINITY_DN2727_c0_g1~~TRINITY_DN2727_c0_g1_i2.p1  ORF type:complete len:124 (-),score=12.27 TRINITY_DN2727_c0_g1_i2:34-405(-)